MSKFDLLIRHGTIVLPAGMQRADIAVSGGRIAALEPEIAGDASETVEAEGFYIFPGLIDSHVHFNEPGREHWEGIDTGSRALAAGGGTLFFDMPLNAHPPTLDAESFQLKLAAAQSKSFVDFAFWGGLVPQNLSRLEELAECGVIGFKAFMADSGIDDFPHLDSHGLREGMKRSASLGLPVAVHAESEATTRALAQTAHAADRNSVRDYLASRPVTAELEAIRCALDLAGETGCALHVVHVSSGAGVALISDARREGINVSCETCPHYLILTEEDMVNLGGVAKCAPPLRASNDQKELWQHLMDGAIDTLGSDHSPSPPELKHDPNFFKVWGGISGMQHTLPLMVTEFLARETSGQNGTTLPHLARLTSTQVAARFQLPADKSGLTVGADADLALVDISRSFPIRLEDLLYRHRQTPYLGRSLRARIVRTLLRGQTIFKDGQIVSKPVGRLVKPVR